MGGVTPGKGGQEHLGVPVFNSVKEAREGKELKFNFFMFNVNLHVFLTFSRQFYLNDLS